jgi:predicted negative regulator of RcsB-dependent stress response
MEFMGTRETHREDDGQIADGTKLNLKMVVGIVFASGSLVWFAASQNSKLNEVLRNQAAYSVAQTILDNKTRETFDKQEKEITDLNFRVREIEKFGTHTVQELAKRVAEMEKEKR